MGNCLHRSSSDDVALLRPGAETAAASTDDELSNAMLPQVGGAGSIGVDHRGNGSRSPSAGQAGHEARPMIESSSSEGHHRVRSNRQHRRRPRASDGYERVEVVYHPTPGTTRSASELTEDEQILIAQRIGWIELLPMEIVDGTKKLPIECIICFNELLVGEEIRRLPCCHTYHRRCIDDWLMRSFTCPSCMKALDECFQANKFEAEPAEGDDEELAAAADNDSVFATAITNLNVPANSAKGSGQGGQNNENDAELVWKTGDVTPTVASNVASTSSVRPVTGDVPNAQLIDIGDDNA